MEPGNESIADAGGSHRNSKSSRGFFGPRRRYKSATERWIGGRPWGRRRYTLRSSKARMEPGNTLIADAGGCNRNSKCSRGSFGPRRWHKSATERWIGGRRWGRRRCTRRSSKARMEPGNTPIADAGGSSRNSKCSRASFDPRLRYKSASERWIGGWRWGRRRRCTLGSSKARMEPGNTPIADAGCSNRNSKCSRASFGPVRRHKSASERWIGGRRWGRRRC
jgi:hypothetical protein